MFNPLRGDTWARCTRYRGADRRTLVSEQPFALELQRPRHMLVYATEGRHFAPDSESGCWRPLIRRCYLRARQKTTPAAIITPTAANSQLCAMFRKSHGAE